MSVRSCRGSAVTNTFPVVTPLTHDRCSEGSIIQFASPKLACSISTGTIAIGGNILPVLVTTLGYQQRQACKKLEVQFDTDHVEILDFTIRYDTSSRHSLSSIGTSASDVTISTTLSQKRSTCSLPTDLPRQTSQRDLYIQKHMLELEVKLEQTKIQMEDNATSVTETLTPIRQDILKAPTAAIDVVLAYQNAVVKLDEELEENSKDVKNVHVHSHSEREVLLRCFVGSLLPLSTQRKNKEKTSPPRDINALILSDAFRLLPKLVMLSNSSSSSSSSTSSERLSVGSLRSRRSNRDRGATRDQSRSRSPLWNGRHSPPRDDRRSKSRVLVAEREKLESRKRLERDRRERSRERLERIVEEERERVEQPLDRQEEPKKQLKFTGDNYEYFLLISRVTNVDDEDEEGKQNEYLEEEGKRVKNWSGLSLRKVAVQGLSKSTIQRLLKSNSVIDVITLSRKHVTTVKKPERTSQARAAAVNHVVIDKYFDDLYDLYEKHKFTEEEIFNTDETNNPTVVKPQNIVAEKGVKAVSSSVGGEQGINVTMLALVNAAGKAFPRTFIFPRVKVNLNKMINLPDGFLPLACPSGWITSELFLMSLQHVLKHVNCSPEKPILLILDNHTSHISYPVVEFCKKSGIVLFTLPPHTSHVTQPLDKCLFGPMKSDMSQEHRHWMRNHPGERIFIYDVPQLTKVPHKRRFNSKNIKSAFVACGIYPFNRHAIPEHMFAPSSGTDLPNVAPPNETEGMNSLSALVSQRDSQQDVLGDIVNRQLNPQAGVSIDVQADNFFPSTSTSQEDGITLLRSAVLPLTLTEMPSNELPRLKTFTPEEVLPHPRVAQTEPRVPRNTNRGSSRVLTNSPEIAKLKEAHKAKVLKEHNHILRENKKFSITAWIIELMFKYVHLYDNFPLFYCREQVCIAKTTATTTLRTQSESVHPPSKSPLLDSATVKATNNKRKLKCNDENVDPDKNYSPSRKSNTIQRTRIPREVKRVFFLG
ncbi:Uncharacterized protein APZ42_033455 [Daphnia magna]|uniref:DDE-1 domain-containing protein n=1 Tax=Daphnia magna TaxID=35525 RepID=A0A164L2R0_9CRUS|nr:Uncharacterized protein APZ42_033455 [Daphnia magna]